MAETLQIDEVNAEVRRTQQGPFWGVKSGGKWYKLTQEAKPQVGARYEVEVRETQYNGKPSRWAKPLRQISGAGGNGTSGGGNIAWTDWAAMTKAAHGLAAGLEPEDAQARAALVNTSMIAFSNGRVALPVGDNSDDEDSQIPF